MGYAAKLRHLPVVLARLRRRAGHQTQRAAARAIRARAGGSISYASLSRWERGAEKPTFESIVRLLDGYGYDLKAIQDELDRADGEEVALAARPHPPPAAGPSVDVLLQRLEALDERLRFIEDKGSRDD
jgi:transcriptional regulator with XRE-family HTH domain